MYNCDICGKGMKDGDRAYATTTGVISDEVDGFWMDEGPWHTVACVECGEKISDAINKLF